MNHELPTIPTGLPLELTDYLKGGLGCYWDRWGPLSKAIRFHLPDFQNPYWKFQDSPYGRTVRGVRFERSEVKGEIIQVPYFKLQKDTDHLAALRDLVYAAQVGGYGIIIDVGSQNSLVPLTVAASHENNVVIALDPYAEPHEQYPDKYYDESYHPDYPYIAKHITQAKIRNSAAFFFRLDVHDREVQKALGEVAWRVQIVAPNPEIDHGDDLINIVFSSANLVGPGGEMLVTGDGIVMNTFRLESLFQPASYTQYTREGREMIQRMTQLQALFSSFTTHGYKGPDLFRNYGISGSGWISGISQVLEPTYRKPIEFTLPPGIAIFGGKK